MRVVIADSQKLYNTLKYIEIDTILWGSQTTSLFSICDNDKGDITHLIANNKALSKSSTIACLDEFSNIQMVPQEEIINGADTVLINNMSFDTKITGTYILYINEENSPQSQQYLLRFLDEKCIYNTRVVGPIGVKHYKYLGNIDAETLLTLIYHSHGCVDYSGNHLYDIAYLEKPCITQAKNTLFTEHLASSQIPKDKLPTLISNLQKALNFNDSSK